MFFCILCCKTWLRNLVLLRYSIIPGILWTFTCILPPDSSFKPIVQTQLKQNRNTSAAISISQKPRASRMSPQVICPRQPRGICATKIKPQSLECLSYRPDLTINRNQLCDLWPSLDYDTRESVVGFFVSAVITTVFVHYIIFIIGFKSELYDYGRIVCLF